MFDNVLIYYFSGTGNAKKTAHWIADVAKQRYANTFVYAIDQESVTELTFPENRGDTLYCFCYPTHGFNAPPLVIKFLSHFPEREHAYVAFFNTRAGSKVGKYFLPGISGIATWLPMAIMWYKNYKFVGAQPVDLPSNWMSIHPSLSKNAIDSMYTKWETIVKIKTLHLFERRKLLIGLLDFPLAILLLPISLGYLLIGRFAFAKTFYATDACTNCNLCVRRCSVQAISYKDNRLYWKYTCESCMRCMSTCPTQAINTLHGYTVILWYIALSLVPGLLSTYFFDFFYHFFPHNLFLRYLLYNFLFVGIGFLLFLFVGYRLFHFLQRFHFFRYITNKTSFTTYSFWKRYKAPKYTDKKNSLNSLLIR